MSWSPCVTRVLLQAGTGPDLKLAYYVLRVYDDTQWGWHAEGGWHAKGGMLQGGMLRGRLSWQAVRTTRAGGLGMQLSGMLRAA